MCADVFHISEFQKHARDIKTTHVTTRDLQKTSADHQLVKMQKEWLVKMQKEWPDHRD
jgi:hypothetical protein